MQVVLKIESHNNNHTALAILEREIVIPIIVCGLASCVCWVAYGFIRCDDKYTWKYFSLILIIMIIIVIINRFYKCRF